MKRYTTLFLLIIFTFQHVVFAQGQTPHPKLVDIAWSPDGTHIASVQEKSTISVWSVDDLVNPILSIDADLADKVIWTPDSKYLIVEGKQTHDDKYLRMLVRKWNATTGELVETLMSFELDTSYEFNYYGFVVFPTLAFNPTREQTAFSFRDGFVFISEGGQVLHLDNPYPTKYVYDMEWNPQNNTIAIVYGSSDVYSIQVFEIESGEVLQIIYQDLQYFVTDLAWDTTGQYLATSSMHYTCCEGWSNVGLYHINNSESTIRFQADRWWYEVNHSDAQIEWHPIKNILAIVTDDAIVFFDPTIEEPVYQIEAKGIIDISWSPDGTHIAGITPNGTIEVWEVESIK